MASEEDKGKGGSRSAGPGGAPVVPPRNASSADAPGWVQPPNLKRAPVIAGAAPTASSPLAPPAPRLAPVPVVSDGVAAEGAASSVPASSRPIPAAANRDPSIPLSRRQPEAVEPRLGDLVASIALGEDAASTDAREPRLEISPDRAEPAAPDKAKARVTPPPITARATERIAESDESPRRHGGGWLALAALVVVLGAGVWLWRQGRLEPILTPVRTMVAKVQSIVSDAPSDTAPSAPTVTTAPTPATTPAATAPTQTATTTAAPTTPTPPPVATSTTTPTAAPGSPTPAPTATAAPGETAAASPAADGAMIQEIKRLLAKLDLAPGPADGTLDPATQAAIRSYQQMAGVPVDGQPSQALLRDLRAVVADQKP